MLKRLRLREQRRQPLKKFTQKAPQPPALKPPSTARTAGRSDWAERRFRRQPFILLFVGASSISLVSAESGENSLIPLRLLFPPNPLRWASAGALFLSSAEPEKPPKICPKTARNPSPGQGHRPAPKEVTQRLTEANMGAPRSVLPVVAAPGSVPLRQAAVDGVVP